MRALLIIFILGFTGMSGCKHTLDNDMSEIDHAQGDLNDGNYPSAIDRLEKYHAKNPSDAEGKLLLATAYAGSVGINLVDSYDFFASLLNNNKEAKRPLTAGKGLDQLGSLGELVKRLQSFMQEISEQGSVFFAIPFIKEEGRAKLEKALALTESVQPEDPIYARVRTYQTFLHILQFSNFFKEMFPGVDFSKMPSGIDLLCSIKAPKLASNFDTSLHYFDKLVGDLEWISTNKKASLGRQVTRLKDLSTFLKGKFNKEDKASAEDVIRKIQADYCT